MRVLAGCCVALILGINGWGQDTAQPNQSAGSSQTTTVRGMVRNGASGGPLARALVRINGDAVTGVLTGGDGRFEIANVAEGPQDFTVVKPGFLDEAEAGADSIAWNSHGYGHDVNVVAEMADVVFTMQPVNSITGQVQLSTGDVAEGIQVTLLRRVVQDGRVVWQSAAAARTNSEGVYRFGDLADGLYAIYTDPTMDNDAAPNLVENGGGNNVVRQGYASVFYPDARDLLGAAKIRVAGGEPAQANISLTLEPFQLVAATVMMPKASSGADNVSVQVMDAQGHVLPYIAQYDSATHTAQAWLPDGTYSLFAMFTTTMSRILSRFGGDTVIFAPSRSQPIGGEASFAVAGRAVSNLRIPMSTMGSNSIQVIVARSANGTSQRGDSHVAVTLSQSAGWMGDGMVSRYADGPVSPSIETTSVPPGSYWVHTSIAPNGLCEASFTAGGANLAQEPLVLGMAGSSAPLTLTLRDDCAKLTLLLPASVGLAAGEELFYTVYVVPDFGSTEDVEPQTLRPSTGGRITLAGLTPGNYHVYAFDRPVALEYRNPAALAALPSQAMTLAPDGETELTVEARQP